MATHTEPIEVREGPIDTVSETNEKKDLALEQEHSIDMKTDSEDGDGIIHDVYVPFPPLKGIAEEPNPLTVRAVVTGIILGSLVNASNVYLGLKTGFTFSATMFGAIFGFGILSFLSKAMPHVPILGGKFGPQENSIIQASATGAGGLTGLFVAGLPAMYQLELLSDNPKKDFGRILTITFVSAFFGTFAAVPLRKFFIVQASRQLNLVFPTPTATAMTIRSMHALGSGATDAAKKIKALSITFVGAMVQIVVSQYADGILHNWHPFTWLYIWSGYKVHTLMTIESWGWYFQITPAFFGSGMLVSMNAAVSWFLGTFVAWAIIGPVLIHYGECEGVNTGEGTIWEGAYSFGKMSGAGQPGFVPSPRFWMLWPGVMVLVVYSMAEFLLNIKVVWDGAKYAFGKASVTINQKMPNNAFFEKQAAKAQANQEDSLDFATPEQQVPIWIWTLGAVLFAIMGIIICHVQFDMNAGLAILSLLLGLLFAFMSIYGAGLTDVAPLTASAKASQLVFGGVTKGTHNVADAQRINLLAGNIASGTADMATNLVSDFRVGFLLRTPPKLQFYAQITGALVAVFLAPGIFVLFMSAYPCVWNPNNIDDKCPFAAPSVTAWRAVAEAVTLPHFPVPKSSGYFSIALGIFCFFQAVVKNFYLVGDRLKYRNYLPNWMSIGIAFVLGADSGYANATLAGAIFAYVWRKRWLANFDTYCYAIAAGLIAGEGIGGVINAAITLGGVDGGKYGTLAGLPGPF